MTSQPFLPQVVAGSVEARHAAVSLRRHLTKTEIIAGRVTKVDHAHKTITVRPAVGEEVPFGRDIVSLASVQHRREAFLAGAYPDGPAGVEAEIVPAGDAHF